MTNEQINIAIAEACGWTCLGQVEGCKPHGYPPDARKPTTKELIKGYGPSPWDVPDYTADLNACHELEKMLDDKQLARYAQQIIGSARRKMNIPDHESHYPVPFIISATARQRCEAYLRTLGKWKE